MQTSVFHTTGTSGDGATTITETAWTSFFRRLLLGDEQATNAVLWGVDGGLAVTGTASPLTVATGAAVVNGYPYYNDAALSLTVTTPAATTGGHVVLRLDTTAHTVRAVVVLNTSGVTTPPAPTQSGSIYEVRLATFTMTNTGVITLTDARGFAHYPTEITDAQVSYRVPRLTDRQGGDANDWGVNGTTNYTPGTVKMEVGQASLSCTTGTNSYALTVTYPTAFTGAPHVFTTANYLAIPPVDTAVNVGTSISTPTKTTKFLINVTTTNTTHGTFVLYVDWLAIGPG